MKNILPWLFALCVLITSVCARQITISAEVSDGVVTADVIFEDNPGIAGFFVNLKFDNTKLTPLSIHTGDALNGHSLASNLQTQDPGTLDYVSAVWADSADNSNDGVFYTVKFKIKEGAVGNTLLQPVCSPGNISNSNRESVNFELKETAVDLGAGSAPELPFEDVLTGDWFFEDVAYAYGHGLMNGTSSQPNMLFSPLIYTNRAMFVTVLHRLEGSPPADFSGFSDVEKGSYYEQAVNWAAANGIVNGISPTEFAPLSGITREQTAKIIANYAQYKNISVSDLYYDLTKFADFEKISDWAKSSLQICAGMDIIRGRSDNTIDPLGGTTRAETAAILRRFMEYAQKSE